MRRLLINVLAFGTFTQALCGLTFAHHPDPTGMLREPGLTTLGTVGMVELGHDEFKVLVLVSYSGLDFETDDHHVNYRAFWVSGQLLTLPKDPTEFDSLVLNFVPVSRIKSSHDGITTGVRFFPSRISRDIEAGFASSITVQAIGWAMRSEVAVETDVNDVNQARFTRFAELAVDVLGLRYLHLAESEDDLLGTQLGSLEGQAGIAWNATERFSVRLSFGGQANAALLSPTLNEAVTEAEIFGRLTLLLRTEKVVFSGFAGGGIHINSSFDREFIDDDGDEAHGHGLVLIGVSATF